MNEKEKWLKDMIVVPLQNNYYLNGQITIYINARREYTLVVATNSQISVPNLPCTFPMYNGSIRVNVTNTVMTIPNKDSLEKFEFDLDSETDRVELIIGFNVVDEQEATRLGRYKGCFKELGKLQSKYLKANNSDFVKGTLLNVEYDEVTAKATGKKFKKFNAMAQDETGNVAQITRFNLSQADFEKVQKLQNGDKVIIGGLWKHDDYTDADMIDVGYLTRISTAKEINIENDNSGAFNRFELNTTTKMSAMQSINDAKDLVNKASEYGLSGLAVTDINSVQGVNDVENASQSKKNLKAFLGCELSVINDLEFKILLGKHFNGTMLEFLRDNDFYVFDTETTGLSRIEDKIVQMSCLHMSKGKEVKFYDEFANPEQEMPVYLQELTHLKDVDLTQYRISEEVVLDWYLNFLDANHPEHKILVAHNAQFDLTMIDTVLLKNGYPKLEDTFTVIDTLVLARFMLRFKRSHQLGELATAFTLQLEAHNSLNDARATAIVMYYLFLMACSDNLTAEKVDEFNFDVDSPYLGNSVKVAKTLNDLASKTTFKPSLVATGLGYFDNFNFDYHVNTIYDLINILNDSFKVPDGNGLIKYPFGYASGISIIPKDVEGRKVLYELISKAHTLRYYRTPRIWLSDIINLTQEQRSHILIGTGGEDSIFNDYLTRLGKDYLKEWVKEIGFDYIEVLPPTTLSYDVHNDDEIVLNHRLIQLHRMFNDLINLEKELNIPVVAVSASEYTLESDNLAKEVLSTKYSERIKPKHLRKPDELKSEFKDYGLDDVTINNWVFNNTMKVMDEVEPFLPPTARRLTPPIMPHAKEELKELTFKGLHKYYGDNPDKRIVDRMNTELDIILNNGYETIYLTAHKLVEKADSNGYFVGSRGSVGSSLVAFFCGITEINALPPHYRSINGNYTEFIDPKEYSDGFDLPPKKNPLDGTDLIGDGHNIPFETFLGADGSKIPDIDLNFDSSWQAEGQEYMKELFGKDHVIRVGTISTLAEKTSFGYVNNFERKNNLHFTKAQKQYLANKIEGTKKTTGQHPAGILVIPKDKTIEDFTPRQYPSNEVGKSWQTSHLPMTTLHDCLLKMDILGHDNPLMLRRLYEMTGIDPHTIKMNDPEVLSLFTSQSALNLPKNVKTIKNNGAVGLPEFGTDFVLEMLQDAQPKTFSDLVQISGLSHGTDVWLGNAKELIDNGTATLKEVIGTRDKLMTDMLKHGLTHAEANEITNNVKKRKPFSKKIINRMKECGVPEWYIHSAQKIKYMFPAGHAVSYTQDSFRIAWYKIHFPWEFYTLYFSIREGDVGSGAISYSPDVLYSYIKQREEKSDLLSKKLEKDKQRALIVLHEAKTRGIKFTKPDINLSKAIEWNLIKDEQGNYEKIVAPLISIKNIGEKQAHNIIKKRNQLENKKFHSMDEVIKSVPKGVFNNLTKGTVLKNIPNYNSLF